MTSNPDFKVTGVTVAALNVLCAQLMPMRDLFAIAKFLVTVADIVTATGAMMSWFVVYCVVIT